MVTVLMVWWSDGGRVSRGCRDEAFVARWWWRCYCGLYKSVGTIRSEEANHRD